MSDVAEIIASTLKDAPDLAASPVALSYLIVARLETAGVL